MAGNLLSSPCLTEAQSSGKVKKAKRYLKRTLAELCQETPESWAKLLFLDFFKMGIELKDTLQLNRFEMLYFRPFLI